MKLKDIKEKEMKDPLFKFHYEVKGNPEKALKDFLSALLQEIEGKKWEMTGHDSVNSETAIITESKEKVAFNHGLSTSIEIIKRHLTI